MPPSLHLVDTNQTRLCDRAKRDPHGVLVGRYRPPVDCPECEELRADWWTIQRIRRANIQAGGRWFDDDKMADTKIEHAPSQGPGGVYFASKNTSATDPEGIRGTWTCWCFNPDGARIGPLLSYTDRATAVGLCDAMAAATPTARRADGLRAARDHGEPVFRLIDDGDTVALWQFFPSGEGRQRAKFARRLLDLLGVRH